MSRGSEHSSTLHLAPEEMSAEQLRKRDALKTAWEAEAERCRVQRGVHAGTEAERGRTQTGAGGSVGALAIDELTEEAYRSSEELHGPRGGNEEQNLEPCEREGKKISASRGHTTADAPRLAKRNREERLLSSKETAAYDDTIAGNQVADEVTGTHAKPLVKEERTDDQNVAAKVLSDQKEHGENTSVDQELVSTVPSASLSKISVNMPRIESPGPVVLGLGKTKEEEEKGGLGGGSSGGGGGADTGACSDPRADNDDGADNDAGADFRVDANSEADADASADAAAAAAAHAPSFAGASASAEEKREAVVRAEATVVAEESDEEQREKEEKADLGLVREGEKEEDKDQEKSVKEDAAAELGRKIKKDVEKYTAEVDKDSPTGSNGSLGNRQSSAREGQDEHEAKFEIRVAKVDREMQNDGESTKEEQAKASKDHEIRQGGVKEAEFPRGKQASRENRKVAGLSGVDDALPGNATVHTNEGGAESSAAAAVGGTATAANPDKALGDGASPGLAATDGNAVQCKDIDKSGLENETQVENTTEEDLVAAQPAVAGQTFSLAKSESKTELAADKLSSAQSDEQGKEIPKVEEASSGTAVQNVVPAVQGESKEKPEGESKAQAIEKETTRARSGAKTAAQVEIGKTKRDEKPVPETVEVAQDRDIAQSDVELSGDEIATAHGDEVSLKGGLDKKVSTQKASEEQMGAVVFGKQTTMEDETEVKSGVVTKEQGGAVHKKKDELLQDHKEGLSQDDKEKGSKDLKPVGKYASQDQNTEANPIEEDAAAKLAEKESKVAKKEGHVSLPPKDKEDTSKASADDEGNVAEEEHVDSKKVGQPGVEEGTGSRVDARNQATEAEEIRKDEHAQALQTSAFESHSQPPAEKEQDREQAPANDQDKAEEIRSAPADQAQEQLSDEQEEAKSKEKDAKLQAGVSSTNDDVKGKKIGMEQSLQGEEQGAQGVDDTRKDLQSEQVSDTETKRRENMQEEEEEEEEEREQEEEEEEEEAANLLTTAAAFQELGEDAHFDLSDLDDDYDAGDDSEGEELAAALMHSSSRPETTSLAHGSSGGSRAANRRSSLVTADGSKVGPQGLQEQLLAETPTVSLEDADSALLNELAGLKPEEIKAITQEALVDVDRVNRKLEDEGKRSKTAKLSSQSGGAGVSPARKRNLRAGLRKIASASRGAGLFSKLVREQEATPEDEVSNSYIARVAEAEEDKKREKAKQVEEAKRMAEARVAQLAAGVSSRDLGGSSSGALSTGADSGKTETAVGFASGKSSPATSSRARSSPSPSIKSSPLAGKSSPASIHGRGRASPGISIKSSPGRPSPVPIAESSPKKMVSLTGKKAKEKKTKRQSKTQSSSSERQQESDRTRIAIAMLASARQFKAMKRQAQRAKIIRKRKKATKRRMRIRNLAQTFHLNFADDITFEPLHLMKQGPSLTNWTPADAPSEESDGPNTDDELEEGGLGVTELCFGDAVFLFSSLLFSSLCKAHVNNKNTRAKAKARGGGCRTRRRTEGDPRKRAQGPAKGRRDGHQDAHRAKLGKVLRRNRGGNEVRVCRRGERARPRG